MPSVREVPLRREYSFQYENFVVATQHQVFLLLEKVETSLFALRFRFARLKYGGPNDEARGGHPLAKHGLGFYGLYEVLDSPWIEEVKSGNRVHPRHDDSLFSDYKHYVACFKDVMLEVISSEFEEVELTEAALLTLIQEQSGFLEIGA